jgi:hypothetical protein
MRNSSFRVVLVLLAVFVSSALCGAADPTWNNLKQLSPGQRVKVVLHGTKSVQGQFQSVTDDALIVRSGGTDQTFPRDSVQQVSLRRSGHRGRNALIGAGIGAGAGLGLGAAVDNNCSPNSIVCTGNYGKAILTPVFGLLGAGIGALFRGGGWQEIYRMQ